MNPVLLMEVVAVVSLLIVFITQIALPVWHGRPLFPFFRDEWKLHRRMEVARQQKAERDLEEQVKQAEQPTTKQE